MMAAHNLPQQPTSFIGRETDIAEITALLGEPTCRLLTLVGPGGIGKTRLALEVAIRVTDQFPDGVHFAALQPLRSADHLLSTVSETLSFYVSAGRDLQKQLLDYLHEKHLLLVLDNFEHVLDGVDLLVEILSAAPKVKVIATSREPLNLREEWIRRVIGLDYPKDETSLPLMTYSAIQLFCEHARRQDGHLRLEEEGSHIIEICRLVDGVPLALELAAAWRRTLSCATIAAEIQKHMDFLMVNTRDIPERHRSMRAVFDHSWRLLTENEARVMRDFVVFRGGCTQEAAEEILGASLHTLSTLVDKSLLHYDPASGRYDIQELQRQYAEEQLEASGEGDHIRDLHCRYYAAFFYARERDNHGPRKAEYLQMVRAELDNIRATWACALERQHYEAIDQLVEAIWMYHNDYSGAVGARSLYEAASQQLRACSGSRERAILGRVLARQGKLAVQDGQAERAEALFRESMAIALEQDNLDEYYYAYRWLGGHIFSYSERRDLPAARQILEECAGYYRQRDDTYYLAITLSNLADVYRRMGQSGPQQELLRESYQLYREIGDAHGMAETLWYLAYPANHEGRWAEADQWLSEALEFSRRAGSVSIFRVDTLISGVAVWRGDFARAERRIEAIRAFSSQTGDSASTMLTQSLIADARGDSVDALRLVEAIRAVPDFPFIPLHPAWGQHRQILGWLLCSCEQFDAASSQLFEALPNALEHHWLADLLFTIAACARIRAHRAEFVRAVELLGLVFTHPNSPQGYLEQHQGMTRLRADLEAQLGTQAYRAAWERGTQLDAEQIARDLLREFSLDSIDPLTQANQALFDPLTPRELEILNLLAAGLMNTVIGNRLFITPGTVKGHVNKILHKLNAETRQQAVMRARELGLLKA